MKPCENVTDPLSDDRKDRPVNSGPQKLVYILTMAFGCALITLGAYCRLLERQTWLPELTIALGVAVAAPGILSFLYRKYLLEDIKTELEKPAIQFKEEATKKIEEAFNYVKNNFDERQISTVYEYQNIIEGYRQEIELLQSSQ